VSDRTITWNWSEPSGNGRPITGYEFRVDGGGWQSTTARSHSQAFGYSETHTLCVRAVNSGGLRSTEPCDQERTADPPTPTVNLSRGRSAQGQAGCSSVECSYLVISWANLGSGGHSYTCHTANDGGAFYTRTTPHFSGSSGTAELYCYADASVWGGVYVRVDGIQSNTANW
jgi:large repetitive protein